MVGYRRNFKNWVENLGGDTPLKFGGPKPPNVENQSWSTRSKLIVRIGPENDYPKLVSKFWGLPPKKILGGSKFKKFDIETRLAQGSRVTLTSNFYKWQWVMMSNLCTPWGGAPPPKKIWGAKFFPNPLG